MSKCILHLLPRNKTVISTKKRMCNRYDTHPLCSWWGQPRGFWQEARSIRTHESGISATLCFVSVVWLSATTISAIYGEPVLSLLSKGFNAILNMVFFCLKNTISSKKNYFFFLDQPLPIHLYEIPFNNLYVPITFGYPRIVNHPIYSFDSWERSDLP